jgi:predicted metallo-beta-lactamase superfamily hydrolase
MWCLWRERNARNFEDVETSVTELRKIVFNTLYTWIAAHHSLLVSNFADFLNFCRSFSSD